MHTELYNILEQINADEHRTCEYCQKSDGFAFLLKIKGKRWLRCKNCLKPVCANPKREVCKKY